MNRRTFLRFATRAGAVGTVALVAACTASTPPGATGPAAPQPPTAAATAAPTPASAASTPATTAPATAPTATAKPARTGGPIPTYTPLTGIKADLPASPDGMVDPAFLNYPANPPKTVQDAPGSGGEISVVTWITTPMPTSMEANTLWQAVNKELGVTLKMNIVAQADYAVTLPTVLAGDDLPDIMYIGPTVVIPQLPAFLKSKMADLTPYLSGDAAKDYPNLANLPSIAWKQMVFDNTLYGIPCSNSLFLWAHWVQQDLLDADGLSPPSNADEYKALAMHFTRPDQGLYGLGVENNVGMGMTNGWITGIFGTPNIWSLDDNTGKLTHYVETDQFRAAVSYARELWAAGAYDPDSLQYNLVSARNQFAARHFMFRMDAWLVASDLFWASAARRDPPGNPRVLSSFPAAAGGKPTYWATNGLLGYSVIKQAPPDRIKEILRVMNWLAAPFGSQEYLLKTYGIKDQHWTPDANGNPILTDRGKADATVPFHYITRGPAAFYWPQTPQNAPIMHDAQNAIYPYISLDPTIVYYSPTNAAKLPALNRDISDKLNDIVTGRQPFEAIDQLTKDWRAAGGDQIRVEFQQAMT
jgi:putative aldouronate transport system substrate-binding protein